MEFERQQVSSSLQDSSRYSGRSQQCCIYNFTPWEIFPSLLADGLSLEFEWQCYIMTVDMDFGLILDDPVCFDKLSRCD